MGSRALTLEPLSPPPRLAPPWTRPLAMGTFLNPLTSSFQIRKWDKQGSYLIGEDNPTLPHVRGNCVKHSVSRLALESEQCAGAKQKRYPQQAELQVTADPFLSQGRAASRGHPGLEGRQLPLEWCLFQGRFQTGIRKRKQNIKTLLLPRLHCQVLQTLRRAQCLSSKELGQQACSQ